MEQFREDTKPLLRPHQIEDMTDEKRRLESTLNAPPHVRSQVEDIGAMRMQLRRLDSQLKHQSPTAYKGEELDQAKKREAVLREQFTAGMPTQAEMRKAPTGAVDKHMAWERRNKTAIMEWKNIQLRLQASGAIDGHQDAREVANIERFRPAGGTGELPMTGTMIPGKDFYFPQHIQAQNVATPDDKQRWEVEKLALIKQLADDGDPVYQKLWADINKAGSTRRVSARTRKES